MRHLELHILQSVPVACLNRDDAGSPKTATFGNVRRGRVSSQCWKRAVRELMKEENPRLFGGERTRLIIGPLADILKDRHGMTEEDARKGAKEIGGEIGKLDTKLDVWPTRVKTLFFTSPLELEALAAAYADCGDAEKAVKGLAKRPMLDAADIALFGRMVASNHSLTLEGAAMFGHALTTHKIGNEIDFFAAVDDRQPEDEAGAGMTGTLEFNSGVFYRFAALNLNLLSSHLSALSEDEYKEVVRNFISATLRAIPGARRNSMNAMTLPSHVLAVIRDEGHPLQLVNAFETPVWTQGGLLGESVRRMEDEYSRMKEIWGLRATLESRLPESSMSEMLDEVSRHVR